jgi:preprotein translocase subunit SecE
MGKEKAIGGWGGSMDFLHGLLSLDVYKRSQGRITRQITCLVIWVVIALAAWRMYAFFHTGVPVAVRYAAPAVLLVAGLWFGYRLVNLPNFADFLIAVEAEMNKVSWPSRQELVRSSIVVIVLIFGLTLVLFAYDNIWAWLLVKVLKVTVI